MTVNKPLGSFVIDEVMVFPIVDCHLQAGQIVFTAHGPTPANVQGRPEGLYQVRLLGADGQEIAAWRAKIAGWKAETGEWVKMRIPWEAQEVIGQAPW